ncbi:MAG TPA: class I SAM-dependent methyltransferase [Casimicrobiaceae bacterium]|nr:class I SAM-dependent methyltransferase [Casimicrobiaceae bacterium]
MVDRQFSDAALAALYDAFCAGSPDFAFYLPMVMSARSVLDIGCGTGALLHATREAGHAGRLCGLDPADGMLQQARKRSDIDWILGDLSTVAWDREFDLVVMTGHAFQVLLGDDEFVSFTTTYTNPSWDRPQTSRSTLRFLDQKSLSVFLSDAGLLIEEQYGYWDRRPLTQASPEIITIARRHR